MMDHLCIGGLELPIDHVNSIVGLLTLILCVLLWHVNLMQPATIHQYHCLPVPVIPRLFSLRLRLLNPLGI